MTTEQFRTLNECVSAAMLRMRLPRCVSRQDVRSEAWVGALTALRQHDATRAPLNVYAALRIRGAVLDYLRSLDPVSRNERKRLKDAGQQGPLCVSLNRLMERTREYAKDTWEPSVAPARETSDQQFRELLRRTRLNQGERRFLQLWLQDLNQREIGRRLHVHESRVAHLKHAVVLKMRAAA